MIFVHLSFFISASAYLFNLSSSVTQKLNSWLPKIIKKVPRACGGLEWDEIVTQLILEMHSHRTPAESIPANIESVCALLSPNREVVEESPSASFVRETRGVLAVSTLTMGAKRIAAAPMIVGVSGDATIVGGASPSTTPR